MQSPSTPPQRSSLPHSPAADSAPRADGHVPTLVHADIAAVDAWIGVRSGEGHVSEYGADRARLERVEELLGVLDRTRPAGASDALIDLTMTRVMRSAHGPTRGGRAAGWPDDGLDPGLDAETARLGHVDDELALETYVNAGHELARVPGALRERASVAHALGRLIARTPAPGIDDRSHALLIERTLQAAQRARAGRTALETPGAGRPGVRWADVASIAAMLMLGVSVVWPLASTVRAHSVRQACAGNMGTLASAFGAYASDFRGALPMATAGLGGSGPWWNVGADPSRSNSANLYTLTRAGYAAVERLACDGNAHCMKSCDRSDARDWPTFQSVSYSYQVMFGRERTTHQQPPQTVILADRSPVVLRAVRGEPIFPMENSPNHQGKGQWTLRLDGSGQWMVSPINTVSGAASPPAKAGGAPNSTLGDNIWLPANLEEVLREVDERMAAGETSGAVALRTRESAAQRRATFLSGSETPASAQDSFLGP